MRYLITGGGTGGHIYPALSIARALTEQDPEAELLYVGTRTGREAAIVPQAGIAFAVISSGGVVNLGLLQRVRGGLRAARGLLEALGHIRRFRPDIVIGTGGFVAGPVLAAARLARVPLVIQEQNAFPGVTNRLAARWATAVFVPYEEARAHFPPGVRLIRAGNPVRPEIASASREAGRQALGLSERDRVLVIMGGSGGARDFNRVAAEAVLQLDVPGLRVVHITGERYFGQVKAQYGDRAPHVTLLPYAHNMPEVYAAADAGLFRAGALTLAEIQVRRLPSVLIPSPNVTHNHQEWNARTLERRGAAIVLREGGLTPADLAAALTRLLTDEALADRMRAALGEVADPDAARTIARRIVGIARQSREAREARRGR
ncbi:undecaprenyldiphospho-muramoylpentapeptide beta-N-acetylglucosaminyltransferase [Symbiobacterium thermophilum]|uniref:UDP-N-acetylglucosamine--N-acetylmuramyl-(pentapeptide) pyrophosphoryl-undecaprenol N-acetylglucosamine transferase n=1 Tax=Symbiobacterium thermophilum (strain DSM 24528 / JCM 14929 / IAM 14863 / T) TaxID=292459 RepID=MURG_SYMTH|nr:undecaprenyldiphospho-muramoylpentapeptide beta-N-acetylglucosaminyltransferase [Symbiobacterium thermophilum]Q67Q48.1 RecName: Full=UDP-N-acetylglucosamine--N-acetylmuramyl-(pentapeptide) pyrophosphoryl-undecaprenol N-acetylglucosamine transferase; AltName: Full=Undecaprenyl-PP-MurNAc-pentapeptide-UDPGlcNAc GlcNAc transferase [Symbiobacterium thermophilum IAM 14863]BAD40195.1 UDP-N-acetylglucosamine-N-acetylmuramyl-pyrophosphoryl-undecaprenol N-acetylglucosamine transferase [Symbiobacterium t